MSKRIEFLLEEYVGMCIGTNAQLFDSVTEGYKWPSRIEVVPSLWCPRRCVNKELEIKATVRHQTRDNSPDEIPVTLMVDIGCDLTGREVLSRQVWKFL